MTAPAACANPMLGPPMPAPTTAAEPLMTPANAATNAAAATADPTALTCTMPPAPASCLPIPHGITLTLPAPDRQKRTEMTAPLESDRSLPRWAHNGTVVNPDPNPANDSLWEYEKQQLGTMANDTAGIFTGTLDGVGASAGYLVASAADAKEETRLTAALVGAGLADIAAMWLMKGAAQKNRVGPEKPRAAVPHLTPKPMRRAPRLDVAARIIADMSPLFAAVVGEPLEPARQPAEVTRTKEIREPAMAGGRRGKKPPRQGSPAAKPGSPRGDEPAESASPRAPVGAQKPVAEAAAQSPSAGIIVYVVVSAGQDRIMGFYLDGRESEIERFAPSSDGEKLIRIEVARTGPKEYTYRADGLGISQLSKPMEETLEDFAIDLMNALEREVHKIN